MNCSEVIKRLSAYADGELSKQDRSDIQAHVNECAACKRELEVLESLQERVHESLMNVESPDMTESVMSLLPRKPLVRRLVWAWVGGVCLAAALIIGFYMKPVAVKQTIVQHPHESKPVTTPLVKMPALQEAEIPVHRTKPRIHIAHKLKEVPTQSIAEEKTGFTIETSVAEVAMPSTNDESRSKIVITTKIGDLTISRTREMVVIPTPIDEAAQFIERPPLKVCESDRLNGS